MLAVVAAALLAGCSHAPIPVAENFPYSAQKKIRSAGHWDVVAGHAVTTALERLGRAGGKAEVVQVVLSEPASPFEQVLREMLVTHLVNAGVAAVDRADAPVKMLVQAQLVRHDSDRPHFIPGLFTALAAGVYVAHYLGVHAHQDAAMAGGLGFAALADVARSQYTGGPTHTELVLTTTLVQGDRHLARNTDVYYIEDRDVALFRKAPALVPAREFKVVSP